MLGTPIWPNMRVPGPRLKNPSAIPAGNSKSDSYTRLYSKPKNACSSAQVAAKVHCRNYSEFNPQASPTGETCPANPSTAAPLPWTHLEEAIRRACQ